MYLRAECLAFTNEKPQAKFSPFCLCPSRSSTSSCTMRSRAPFRSRMENWNQWKAVQLTQSSLSMKPKRQSSQLRERQAALPIIASRGKQRAPPLHLGEAGRSSRRSRRSPREMALPSQQWCDRKWSVHGCEIIRSDVLFYYSIFYMSNVKKKRKSCQPLAYFSKANWIYCFISNFNEVQVLDLSSRSVLIMSLLYAGDKLSKWIWFSTL